MTTLIVTAADVLAVTGETVTDAQVSKAHFDIEIGCGRPFTEFSSGVLSDMDLVWLKRAVAYQAAFVKNMPDKDTTVDAVSLSAKTGSVTPTPDGLVIAPMARRALANLTWVGARAVDIGNGPALTSGQIQSALNNADIELPGIDWRPVS